MRRVNHGRRDTEITRLAGWLRHKNFDQDIAEEIVRLAANNCKPEFDEDEAVRKVEYAWENWEPGEGHTCYQQPAVKVVSARDLMRKKFKLREYVIEGNAPVGVGLVAGKPKIGKSWLILNESIAVAMGDLALGAMRTRQGRVLYMALEDSEQRLQDRLRDALAREIVPDNFDIATECPRIGEGFEAWLREYLDNHPDTVYVGIDTLKKIRPRERVNKSVYDLDYEALEPLLPIAAKYNITIQAVHHLNKLVDPDDPLDAISGSMGLTGGVDSIRILNRERGTAAAFMYVTGRDIEEQKYALVFDEYKVSWQLRGDAEDVLLSDARRAILDALRTEGQPLSAAAVAQKIGKERTEVSKLIGKKFRAGLVEEVSPHKYVVTTHSSHSDSPVNTPVNTGHSPNSDSYQENPEPVNGVNGVTTLQSQVTANALVKLLKTVGRIDFRHPDATDEDIRGMLFEWFEDVPESITVEHIRKAREFLREAA
jgi:hypothetical protein